MTTRRPIVLVDAQLSQLPPNDTVSIYKAVLDKGLASSPSLTFTGDENTGIYSPGADQVAISTGGTGRLFVDASGRVGIGTSAPTNALHIAANTPYIQFEDIDNNQDWQLQATAWFALRNQTSATELLRITSDGKVGIGASTPLDDLHIASASPALLLEEKDAGTDEKYWRIRADGSTLRFEGVNDAFNATTAWLSVTRSAGARTADSIVFNTGTSERLLITSTGNVGIGTSSPGAILELQQNAATALRITRQNAVSNYCKIEAAGSNSEQLTIETDPQNIGTGFIDFRNGAASKLRITPTGVGIGTGTPAAPLDIASTLPNIRLTDTDTANTYSTIEANNGTLIYQSDKGNAQANSGHFFYVDGSERFRCDSSGRLLVGTSSNRNSRFGTSAYSTQLQIESDGVTTGLAVSRFNDTSSCAFLNLQKGRGTKGSPTIVAADDLTGTIVFSGYDGANWTNSAQIKSEVDGTPGANDMPGRIVLSTTASGASSPTERMRIQANGSILFADDDEAGIIAGSVNGKSIESGSIMRSSRATTSNATHFAFYNTNGLVGQISTSASATSYTTSSDYRLKENVTPVTDGITRLQQLKPSRFNFIADPAKTVDGFLAHEVQTIVPEAITGEKNAVDDEGNPVYQGIDQSKLVPLLTAALQEAVARIETLEAKVTALESA